MHNRTSWIDRELAYQYENRRDHVGNDKDFDEDLEFDIEDRDRDYGCDTNDDWGDEHYEDESYREVSFWEEMKEWGHAEYSDPDY